MALTWRDDLDGVDWQRLSDVFLAAPLGIKPAADLQVVFTNSRVRVFLYDDGELVGAGRVLSDGVDVAYVCDIALAPSHQGRGLGEALVQRLMDAVADHKKIILYAVPGKEDFYRRFGFRRMSTAMAVFTNPVLAAKKGYFDED